MCLCVCVSMCFVALMWRQKTLIKSELAQLDKFIKIYAVQALRNWERESDLRSPMPDTLLPIANASHSPQLSMVRPK